MTNLTSDEHWLCSQIDHPAGRDFRTSGCLGERGYSADPRHDPRPEPVPAVEETDWEAVALVGMILVATGLVALIVACQLWKAGLGLTGVGLVGLTVLAVKAWREEKQ
jgi:hypothetical protein